MGAHAAGVSRTADELEAPSGRGTGVQGFGGVPAATLAQTYGTPLLAFDLETFDRNVARFAALGTELGIGVSYAAKAFLLVALARRLAPTPLGLDVCSLGELVTAERAGFPAARLVMHGCAKTDEELRAAAAGRVGRLVVDNHEEIARLAVHADARRPLRVLLRVNAGIAAQTHAYVRTGGEDSKFGFSPSEIPAASAAVSATPGLVLAGLHSHLGSQIFEAAPYLASLDVLLDLAAELDRQPVAPGAHRTMEADAFTLVVGGGFGVAVRRNISDCDAPRGAACDDAARDNVAGDHDPQGPSDTAADEPSAFRYEAVLRELAQRAVRGSRARGIRQPRLGIEPGRALVAEAGTSLYRVAAMKQHGGRRFVIVDGGIADNPRPALYGAFHAPQLVGRDATGSLEDATVCGRSCENDVLAVAPLPSDVRTGDLLAMAQAGAYTYSMASNYNRFPRPAVVFVGNGTHRLAARREAEADLVRNDVDDAGYRP